MRQDAYAHARSAAPRAFNPGWASRLTPLLLAIAAVIGLGLMAADLRLAEAKPLDGVERLIRLLRAMVPPSSGGDLPHIVKALGETLAMAFVGTLLAASLALPLGVVGAKTIVRQPVIHFVFRRFLDLFRGVPVLVWGLILISAFGLGPFAGVLALALAEAPHMAKVFAEAIEAADARPMEGVRSTGAPWPHILRLALLPEVAPVMAGQWLYYLESNFRHAAVLGIVGAGGIGFELEERIRVFDFHVVAFIILLYMVVVGLLDAVSQQLRRRLR